MNTQVPYEELMSLLQTKQEATRFLETLSELSESLYDTKVPPDKQLDKFLSPKEKQALLLLWKNNGISVENKTQTQNFLQVLQKQIELLPSITIAFAFEPSITFLKSVTSFISTAMQQPTLVETVVDPTIVAGAVITINGTYADFSAKKRLQEYLRSYYPTPMTHV